MRDVYTSVVVAVMVAHFAFLAYLVIGGFLALRWPRSIWLHAAAVAWAIGSLGWHFPCPLTWLERWARAHAGLAALPPGGFIDHYLTGVLYPAGFVWVVRALAFLAVAGSWAVFAATRPRRGHRNVRSRAVTSTRLGRL